MKIDKISFTHEHLKKLPQDEQILLVQAGIVINDLRFFNLSLWTHLHYLKSGGSKNELEIGIFLSQVVILLSQLASKLHESNNVLKESYFSRPAIAKKYHSDLSEEARQAIKRIKKYFSDNKNLATMIRNNFGSHYDRHMISEMLPLFSNDTRHAAYFPDSLNSAFIEFGQTMGMHSMLKATGMNDAIKALFRIYNELSNELLRDVLIFYHALLQVMGPTLESYREQTNFSPSPNSPILCINIQKWCELWNVKMPSA